MGMRERRSGVLAAALLTNMVVAGATTSGPGHVAGAGTKDNVALVQRAFDAWASGTGSPYELLADDVVWTITGNSLASKVYTSRAAFMNEVIRPFNARMSVGLRPVIHRIYADGDSVIVHFDARGTARDGRVYANTYAWFLQVRDSKVVHATAFFDAVAFNDLWTRVRLP